MIPIIVINIISYVMLLLRLNQNSSVYFPNTLYSIGFIYIAE